MSSTSLADILGDGQAFTQVFVAPMVQAVREEMQAHVKDVNAALNTVRAYEGRLVKLEKDQRKALLGWSLYATAAAGLFAYGWNWIKAHIRLG